MNSPPPPSLLSCETFEKIIHVKDHPFRNIQCVWPVRPDKPIFNRERGKKKGLLKNPPLKFRSRSRLSAATPPPLRTLVTTNPLLGDVHFFFLLPFLYSSLQKKRVSPTSAAAKPRALGVQPPLISCVNAEGGEGRWEHQEDVTLCFHTLPFFEAQCRRRRSRRSLF